MFGNKSSPSRIWSFGAKAPHQGAERYNEQMRLQRKYRNRLIETYRQQHHLIDEMIRELYPNLVDAESAVLEADRLVKAAESDVQQDKAKTGKRTACKAVKDALKLAKDRLKDARSARKAITDVAYKDPEYLARRSAIEESSNEARRAARKEAVDNGTYWGNYLIQEAAIETTIKKEIDNARKEGRPRQPPEFRRWDGSGACAVQLQGGRSWEEVGSTGTQLRIEPLPLATAEDRPEGDTRPLPDPNSKRSQKRRRAIVSLRTGGKGRNPEWTQFTTFLTREMPADAQIKWAKLHRRIVGPTPEHQFQITVSREEGWDKDDWAEDGEAAANFGWRKLADGSMRVGFWVGSDGQKSQIVLPASLLDKWDKCDSLQEIRKREFNAHRDLLSGWIKSATTEPPPWFLEATARIGQWLSPERMAGVVVKWRDNRFDGDQDIFETMEKWRKQDKHLWTWESSSRTKAIRTRDYLYRCLAADLSRKYRTLGIDDSNYAEMKKKPGLEQDDEMFARRAAGIASVGRLRQLLRERFAESQELEAENVTRTCCHCGTITAFDAGRDIWTTCPHCDVRADQDERAATNLLRLLQARIREQQPA